jgi:putative heme-binding domain-containing protein
MVRFRPDSGQLEYLSSSTQFGHSFDAWGRHFTVSNEDHIRQEVIRARYLTRNPHLPIGSAMERISDHRPAADVYPITQNARVEMLSGVGSFTSACGLTVYLGGAFSPALGLFSLVAEPAHSLVHRDVLTPSGATYVATRARARIEFLASTDAWFRPVNFYVGPDGAIYLVDYYRLVVEHPEWMDTHTHTSPDLYQGADRGRIYRISPEQPLPLPGSIRLGGASIEELVRLLASTNIWWRRTAQRLLVDRRDRNAVAPLIRLFESSQSALARLHALWTLDGLDSLEVPLIEKALEDPEAGVRENAILLSEPHAARHAAIVNKLLNMERDPDHRVRLQLLLTLGNVSSPASRAAQDRLLAQGIDDPWTQIAALSASSDRAPQLFHAAAAYTEVHTAARATLLRQIGATIGARRQPAEMRQMLRVLLKSATAGSSWWRAASLDGLAQGLGNTRGRTDLGQDLLLRLFEGPDAAVRRASLRVLAATGLPANAAPLLRKAAAAAESDSQDAALRADSIGLLALADPAVHEALFRKLIDPRQPDEVQSSAVRALGRVKGPAVGIFLIERWQSMTPTVRAEAADALFLDPDRPQQLVDAIRANVVQPWTLEFRHKRQLLMNRDVALREAARSLLEEKAGDRDEVLKRYQAALEKTGNPQRGRAVFENVCAKCHRLNDLGRDVGPDLATIRHRPAQLILADIIMPSRSIAQNYDSYVVETKSSGIVIGVLSAQTPTTITIRREEGNEDVIRRDDVLAMRVTELSAMPADVDQLVTIDQMADLLAFLKTPP